MRKNYVKICSLALGLFALNSVSYAQYFSDGFETGLGSWTLTNSGAGDWLTGDGTYYGPGSAQQAANAAYFDVWDYSSGESADMTSGIIDLTAATAPQLTFWHWNSDGSDPVSVSVSTDGVSFSNVLTLPTTDAAWTKYTVDLSAYAGNATVYIQFSCVSDWGSTNPYIDNVVLAEPPACPEVTGLTLNTVYSDSVDISWNAGGTEVMWNFQWGAPGFTPGTGTEIGSDTSYTLTHIVSPLAPNTNYDIYVQANCGSDSSLWVGPLSVYTGYCLISNSGSGSYYIKDFSTTNGLTSNITNNNSGYSPNGYLDTTELVVSSYAAGPAVNFYTDFAGGSYNGINIWVDWNNNLIFDASENVFAPMTYNSSYTGSIAVPGGTPVGNYRMRVVTDEYTSNPSPCGSIGDGEAEDYTFQVLPTPTCFPVSNVAVTYTATDSIGINWTAGGIETDWVIQWGTPGFTPGTGAELGQDTSGNTMDTISGLMSGTDYDIYVRADCGGGDSSYWIMVQGQTDCSTSNLPWVEDFETVSPTGFGLFPNCWFDETATWSTTSTSSVFLVSADHPFQNYIWTPMFHLDSGTTYEFTFQYGGNDNSGWDGAIYTNTTQSSTGALLLDTNFIISTDTATISMKKKRYCFVPDSTADYSFGIYIDYTGGGFFSQKIMNFDNFSLRAPSGVAGTSGMDSVCQTTGLVNLNNIVTNRDSLGMWMFGLNPNAIVNDTMFNPAAIPSGLQNVYYVVDGCRPDSATAAITIIPASDAGTDGTLATCNYGPVNLYDGLTGNLDLGGQWYDPASQPIPGSIVTFNGEIAGSYNYIYVVSNGTCPADTSITEVQLSDCSGIDEYALKGFVMYPNPTNAIVNIQYSGAGESTELTVTDIKGSLIWSNKVNFSEGTVQPIDLSHVEPGIYFINIAGQSGKNVLKVVRN